MGVPFRCRLRVGYRWLAFFSPAIVTIAYLSIAGRLDSQIAIWVKYFSSALILLLGAYIALEWRPTQQRNELAQRGFSLSMFHLNLLELRFGAHMLNRVPSKEQLLVIPGMVGRTDRDLIIESLNRLRA